MQTVLLLSSAFLCFFSIFCLSSFDTVTTLMLNRLASFLPFFEVIPEIYSIFAKKKVIMKYTDKDIQQAIELSQYAANKCSELEDYSIEMEEQLFRLQRKCSLIRTLQITTPISLLIGLLLGLLI